MRTEFLSPYGLRALSKYHQEHPFVHAVRTARITALITSPPNPAPGCSEEIRTGADRSGFR